MFQSKALLSPKQTQSSKLVNNPITPPRRHPAAYLAPLAKGNEYEVNYFGRSIYLTTEEYQHFEAELSKGKKIIKIGDMLLSRSFSFAIRYRHDL